MTLRDRLLHLLRVPPAPSAPAGDEQVRIFRAAPNYFRYKVLIWALRQASALSGIVVYLFIFAPRIPEFGPESVRIAFFTVTRDTVYWWINLAEYAAIAAFPVQMVASLSLLRLDFEQRWYIVSDRSLRIREGLVSLHEKTMTFANVQHVGVRQNPIQRVLGLSDVEVRTAGGSTSKEDDHDRDKDMHVGLLRGVNDPEQIRDVIKERLRGHRDAGLGDPDDHHLPPAAAAPAALLAPAMAEAAEALLREARALRAAVGRIGS
jgi:membrane protein YdbS with pleckstrin-like domain